jgi:predicted metal-dependent hydrolase
MKLLICTIASCIALTATPATATTVSGTDYTALVQVVDSAEAAWKNDQPTEPYWQDVLSQLPAYGDAQGPNGARLKRAINDLLERARNAHLIIEDFWRAKGMIIDAKCCAEIRGLWKQAKNRKATRAQFMRVAGLLDERADAAKEHPDLRLRLQEAIDKLMKKYLAGEDLMPMETKFFDDESVRAMLDRALAWLEDMAVARQATREQFVYVRDLMRDRARIWSEDLEMKALLRRVEAEIDRLLAIHRKLGAPGFSREDFLKLREMCMKKARMVVSG